MAQYNEVVRRSGKDNAQLWRLTSDHPAYTYHLQAKERRPPNETGTWYWVPNNFYTVVLDKDLSDMIPTEAKLKADFMQPTIRKIVAEGMYWIIYPISNSPRLHIFGAGHVGQAIAIQAGLLELDTSVYDDRKELLTAERFPEAERINFNSPGEWKEAPFSSRDFVVIASREHRHDRALLEMALKNPPAYIGLLASKRKWLLMHERLLEDGYPQETLDKVLSPVGLPINAQTVPEIAVSIIGQIIEHFRNEG